MIIKDQPTIFANLPLFCGFGSVGDQILGSNLQADDRQTLTAFRQDANKLFRLSPEKIKDYALMRTDYTDQNWDWQDSQVIISSLQHKPEPASHYLFTNALVTTTPGLALCLWTADCQAVTLFDPQNKVLALAHLGWQATVHHLLKAVISKLNVNYRTDPARLLAYIGPSIRAESYVFAELAQAGDPSWKKYLIRTKDGWGIDLLGYNTEQLHQSGMRPENIEISPIDTAHSDDYESHYLHTKKDLPKARRFLSVSMLF